MSSDLDQAVAEAMGVKLLPKSWPSPFSTDYSLLPQMVEWLEKYTTSWTIEADERLEDGRVVEWIYRGNAWYVVNALRDVQYLEVSQDSPNYQQAICRLIVEVGKANGK